MTAHEAIQHVKTENFPENKVGRQVYTHRIDTNKLPLDRDFEVEWVEGPVRFRLFRDDTADYWLFEAKAAGVVQKMRDGYEEDAMSGSRGGGGDSQRTTVSPAPEDYQESFGNGDVIFINTSVDLWKNPTDVEWASKAMIRAQLETLARHVVKRIKHTQRETGLTRAAVSMLKERLQPVRGAVRDTAYLLGLRERTHAATRVEENNYPAGPDYGDPELLSGVAKHIARLAWKAGAIEKPYFVEYQEKLDERRREQQPPQQPERRSPPPQKSAPSEKNNTCPECGGRYHKKDLVAEGFEKGGGDLTGTEWRCPDRGEVVGEESSYNGPVPVETPSGTELQ